jgi:N-acetylglucosaminyl-diphospho-decaprenol L-rhamnosyltransferase
MKVLIVIVSYKVTDLTIDCLRSLAGEIHRLPGTHVALLENGTGPEDERRLREAIDANGWGDWVTLTAVMPNRGFTGGNNLLIRPALESPDPPQYVLLLNTDTIVLPHALDALVEFMDANPKVGIAGSRLEMPDGTVHVSAFRYLTIASELDRGMRLGFVTKLLGRWAASPPPSPVACEADWVAGASMIVRKEVLDAIGLLDEDYYTYFDDVDFCLRARRAGWPTWYLPQSRVIHLVGCSTKISTPVTQGAKRRPQYWFEARRRFFIKSYGAAYAALVDLAFMAGFAVWRFRRWVQRKPDPDPPHMLWDTFRNSVLLTGPRLRAVENPVLREWQGPISQTAPGSGSR